MCALIAAAKQVKHLCTHLMDLPSCMHALLVLINHLAPLPILAFFVSSFFALTAKLKEQLIMCARNIHLCTRRHAVQPHKSGYKTPNNVVGSRRKRKKTIKLPPCVLINCFIFYLFIYSFAASSFLIIPSIAKWGVVRHNMMVPLLWPHTKPHNFWNRIQDRTFKKT